MGVQDRHYPDRRHHVDETSDRRGSEIGSYYRARRRDFLAGTAAGKYQVSLPPFLNTRTRLSQLTSSAGRSQACWINLVNATQSEMGSCLQLDTLAQLLVQDPANSTFADSASTYLSAMCGQAQCSQQAIDAWKPAFDWDCGLAEDSGTPLVQALDMTLKLYTSAYRNLACDITLSVAT